MGVIDFYKNNTHTKRYRAFIIDNREIDENV